MSTNQKNIKKEKEIGKGPKQSASAIQDGSHLTPCSAQLATVEYMLASKLGVEEKHSCTSCWGFPRKEYRVIFTSWCRGLKIKPLDHPAQRLELLNHESHRRKGDDADASNAGPTLCYCILCYIVYWWRFGW